MSRGFENRVFVEREAIILVNARMPTDRGLAGLPEREVERWRRDVDWQALGLNERDVIALISAVRETCQAVADQSRGAFVDEEFDQKSALFALDSLRRALISGTSG